MIKTIYTTFVALLLSTISLSQYSIDGTIKDNNGSPLPWVNIQLVNSNYIAVSDGTGYFKLSDLKPDTYEVKFSFVGYKTLTKFITITDKDVNLASINLEEKTEIVDEITISATKMDNSIPTTNSIVTKKEIEKNNLGQDIPFLLQNTPSMVVSSDAGAGVGYTYMRIRGTDDSRINVTINGIPLNNAESHGVFFINLPDFASSLESVQIQRGAGTSTNGAGAFGASINLFTDFRNTKAYGETSNSFGSFNTMKNTVKFGTGLINNKFSFDGRLSKIKSDGYMDRASSDLKSYYFSGQYASGKNSLKFITFSGKEKTYQAWYGVPKDSLKTNRTYNPYTYENEVDNYQQTHYQLFYNRKINNNLLLNTALHYTKGAGYFEQYKSEEDMADYNINPIFRTTDTITTTDLIRRRWLDNDFYGGIFSLIYTPNNKLKSTLGGGYNIYEGGHYGEVIWARHAGNNEIRNRYYDNNATKKDGNIYLQNGYQFSKKWNGFLDLQIRSISYNFLGYDNSLENIQQEVNYTFFNPKVGISYNLNSSTNFYSLFAIANKEPNRKDLTGSSPTSRPKNETLYDIELGFKKSKKNYALSINGYFMNYENQLVATGEINDVGGSVRTNIDKSYRAGIEIEGGVQITKGLKWSGNVTLSQNKINKWTEYVDNWDLGGKDSVTYNNSTLAFSPSIIGSSVFEFSVFKQFGVNKKDALTISLISKHVGEQFIDNTQNNDIKLDAYFTHDLRINYSLKLNPFREITLYGSVYNLLNNLYSANAWAYKYSTGGEFQQDIGYFPQATRNVMIGVSIKF
jgi:iron complex outermembrane receptor protein